MFKVTFDCFCANCFGQWLDWSISRFYSNGSAEGHSLGMGLWLMLSFLIGILLRVTIQDWNNFGIKPNPNREL